jgi:hypothetical protein
MRIKCFIFVVISMYMTLTLAIIGALVCAIGLGLIKAAENWNDMTKPPKGWMQHKGVRTKIPKRSS